MRIASDASTRQDTLAQGGLPRLKKIPPQKICAPVPGSEGVRSTTVAALIGVLEADSDVTQAGSWTHPKSVSSLP
jgi:hypothetical protein